MQYSLTTSKLVALLGVVGVLPLVACHGLSRRQTEDVGGAQNAWEQDTGIVSTFLSNAATFSGATLVAQAQQALNAENDELTHKAVLDAVFLNVADPNPLVVQANEVLVGEQTFNNVVINLQTFVDEGASFSTQDIINLVGVINGVRCTEVLPAIDLYFQAAAEVVQDGIQLTAVRPTNCPSGSKQKREL
ncbi:uncharacterized protein Z520_02343 [Fonsecaea multimorphosa CBS 102226]|uniref:Uncharacterized protein n=1 Tax=Fonsecaea multimorphosa CBS 102226 TaxID=1442371 RepID=A0A0D2KFG0_9EURO|nr:uncharacterized protein Z520_02343 [Fonsecaea multimorphosa CBS 102226]KIY02205.1 hypothetical protein Z520_02343 [Fonsecaea multimorphosa CBS 102226]OAL29397.1 hypothetical protein AYO22_02291 [Fonsecaea multimorphosa]